MKLLKRIGFILAALIVIFISMTAGFYVSLPDAVRAQVNTFCAVNLTCTITAAWTFSSINKALYVDQAGGTTADAKATNACSALPAGGGTLDFTGFGAGFQATAAALQCGSSTKAVKLRFDPSVCFQPGSASQSVFQFSDQNLVEGGLCIDTTNQPTYSAAALTNAAQGITTGRLSNVTVTQASGTTGLCIDFNSTSSSIFLTFKYAYAITCIIAGGSTAPAATAVRFRTSGAGFINGTRWFGLDVTGYQHGLVFNQTGTGGIDSNQIYGYECEALSSANVVDCLNITATGGSGNFATMNQIYMSCWDFAGTACVNMGSATGIGRNIIAGQLVSTSDSSTFLSNLYYDLSGGTLNSVATDPTNLPDVTVRDQLKVTRTLRSGVSVSDQGTPCTNGELALSVGWQSTGTATVTAVAGNGQTCSWTITTGTTTAANPTVTDTLTNTFPAATTVCEMNIHGGTHTAAAGEGFQQTTLSATAPVFTFNGTPTAGGTTYFITRRCGP